MIERCVDTSYACYSDKEQRLSWSSQVAVQDHDDEIHRHNNNILRMHYEHMDDVSLHTYKHRHMYTHTIMYNKTVPLLL